MKIWVDDLRTVPDGYVGTKSVNETIKIIENAEKDGVMIELIDLDHDLGDYASDGGDAIRILDYLVERGTYYPIDIHTANPVGRANMERMIQRYWK
ncbi:MAG: cyclic-phosphate processing receiver domain-containing protein [Lachnospiraceae bacterium]